MKKFIKIYGQEMTYELKDGYYSLPTEPVDVVRERCVLHDYIYDEPSYEAMKDYYHLFDIDLDGMIAQVKSSDDLFHFNYYHSIKNAAQVKKSADDLDLAGEEIYNALNDDEKRTIIDQYFKHILEWGVTRVIPVWIDKNKNIVCESTLSLDEDRERLEGKGYKNADELFCYWYTKYTEAPEYFLCPVNLYFFEGYDDAAESEHGDFFDFYGWRMNS